jgi:hypothetical protein
MIFTHDRDGKWVYEHNKTREDLAITVELPNGHSALIKRLSVNEARVTLGMSSCPSSQAENLLARDKEKASLGPTELMKSKAMEWAGQAQSSKVLAKGKYGLCANSDHYNSLVTVIR